MRVIDRGELPSEALLPTERELAAELGVSRTTVVTAYRGLKREGRLRSRQGRGTWIPASAGAARAGAAAPITAELFGAMFEDEGGQMIDLTAACPEPNPAMVAVMRAWSGEDLARTLHGHGYLPAGLPDLRAAIAARFTDEGLPTTPEQIVVTNGGQQAIALAVALLVPRDAAVLTEDPTYPGTLDQLRAHGARPVGMPMDGDGVATDDLDAMVAQHRPAAMYLIPSFHNPTGALLAPDRGARIAHLALRTGLPVVEDEVLRDIWIQGRRPGPYLASHEPDAPVLTIGSLSKTLWGGLRVGWVRAPRSLAERLARARLLADLGGSLPAQAMALRFMPTLAEAAELRREIVRETCATATAEIARGLPGWRFTPPLGGATLWLHMPWGDARAFANLAQRCGVSVLPGHVMSTNGGFGDHLRVSLLASPAHLREGIRRMATAWAAYEAAAAPHAVVV